MLSHAIVKKPMGEMETLLMERDMLKVEIASLEEECQNERNDAGLGYHEASHRADDISKQIAIRTKNLQDIQKSIDRINNEVAQKRPALEAQARIDRDLLVARLAQERVALAMKIQSHLDAGGDLLREFEMNGRNLAEAAGHQEAYRLFANLGAVCHRIQRAFKRTFEVLDDRDGKRQSGAPLARYLPYDLPLIGEAFYKHTLPELEIIALDNLPLNIFTTRDLAEAACKRRDPSGRLLHVKADGDYFTIIAGELRGLAAKSTAA